MSKIEEAQIKIRDKLQNLERLTAQRNELNSKVRSMREELQMLHEPGSYVGEVVKAMGKSKVLVKVGPEGKYVVDLDKDIDINKCTPNTRVALKSDSYTLHKILPTKVDALVSLMKVTFKIYLMCGNPQDIFYKIYLHPHFITSLRLRKCRTQRMIWWVALTNRFKKLRKLLSYQ